MRFIIASFALTVLSAPAHAGIDETINNFTAPIATLIGQLVFFKITLFGAGLPLVVLWLVAGLAQIVLIDRGDEAAIVIDIFSALLAVTCYAAILVGFGKGERLTQMVTAALGCSALLLSAFTFCFLLSQLIGSQTLVALFFWVYLP